jgi:Tfp pilus assembly protein PilE
MRAGQRGWTGMLILLVALAIVGFLAKDALKAYLGVGA